MLIPFPGRKDDAQGFETVQEILQVFRSGNRAELLRRFKHVYFQDEEKLQELFSGLFGQSGELEEYMDGRDFQTAMLSWMLTKHPERTRKHFKPQLKNMGLWKDES